MRRYLIPQSELFGSTFRTNKDDMNKYRDLVYQEVYSPSPNKNNKGSLSVLMEKLYRQNTLY